MDENNSDNMVIIDLIPEPSFRPMTIDSEPQNNIYSKKTLARLSEILKKKDEKFIADANMNINETTYFEPPEYWKNLELSDL